MQQIRDFCVPPSKSPNDDCYFLSKVELTLLDFSSPGNPHVIGKSLDLYMDSDFAQPIENGEYFLSVSSNRANHRNVEIAVHLFQVTDDGIIEVKKPNETAFFPFHYKRGNV